MIEHFINDLFEITLKLDGNLDKLSSETVEFHYNLNKRSYLFSFGQGHIHKVGKDVFDHSVLVKITAVSMSNARRRMFDTFGDKWCFCYEGAREKDLDFMKFFPRGVIEL